MKPSAPLKNPFTQPLTPIPILWEFITSILVAGINKVVAKPLKFSIQAKISSLPPLFLLLETNRAKLSNLIPLYNLYAPFLFTHPFPLKREAGSISGSFSFNFYYFKS